MSRVSKNRENTSTVEVKKSEDESTTMENNRGDPLNPAKKSASEQLDNAVKQRKKRRTKEEMQQENEAAKVLEQIYDPRYWTPLACAPANAMLTITGDEVWNIPEAEAHLLGSNAALCARYLSITDPKWLAIFMAIFHFGNSYGTRAGVYYFNRSKDKKDKKEKAKNDNE